MDMNMNFKEKEREYEFNIIFSSLLSLFFEIVEITLKILICDIDQQMKKKNNEIKKYKRNWIINESKSG